MGTIADKLDYLVNIKEEIRTAINEKGVAVGTTVPFMDYGDKIRDINTSGGGSDIRQYVPVDVMRSTSTVTASGTVV